MKAARLHAHGEALAIDDVPTPTPRESEVLVRIEGAGFCHSDIHVIDGEIRVLRRRRRPHTARSNRNSAP